MFRGMLDCGYKTIKNEASFTPHTLKSSPIQGFTSPPRTPTPSLALQGFTPPHHTLPAGGYTAPSPHHTHTLPSSAGLARGSDLTPHTSHTLTP